MLVRRFCFVFFILVLLLISWLIGWVGRDVVAKRDSSSYQLYVRGCVEQFTENFLRLMHRQERISESDCRQLAEKFQEDVSRGPNARNAKCWQRGFFRRLRMSLRLP